MLGGLKRLEKEVKEKQKTSESLSGEVQTLTSKINDLDSKMEANSGQLKGLRKKAAQL